MPAVIADVIATYGRHLLLRDAAGALQDARPFGRELQIVCGDRVECERHGAELLAVAVLPRSSLLRRSNLRGQCEPLAANLTQMAVVVAPVPAPDLFLLDRYLSAAESLGLRAFVLINKSDLADAAGLREALSAHEALGYRVVVVSTVHDGAVRPLVDALRNHVTVLLGQSGVGKSSLTGLTTIADSTIAIGALMRNEEGRHTTTASRLYECLEGGRMIDTPGVRDSAPAIEDLEPGTMGFREIARFASGCRFLDCRHMQEPECAIRAAVDAGTIDARRYESYRRLRRLFEQLRDRRSEGARAARRR